MNQLVRSRFLIPYCIAAVLLAVFVWAVSFSVVSRDRDERLAAGSERAAELSRFFEANTRVILNSSDSYLQAARRVFEQNMSLNDLRRFWQDVPYDNNHLSHLTVIDADGDVRFVSELPVDPSRNAGDRDYFKALQTASGDPLIISLPFAGRNTGKLTIRMARRLTMPNGEFGGVIFVALYPDSFTEFFTTLNLGPNSSATLVGFDKKIRARSHYGRLGPGQDISGSRIWQELAASPIGSYKQTSVVDGVTRHYAYRAMDDFELVAAIGLATDDITQSANAFRQSVLTIAGLVTLVIAVVFLLVIRDRLNWAKLEHEIEVRRQAEQELQSANADLTQFAYSASHDLKAPLSSITGLLTLCQEDLDDGEYGEVSENLKRAQKMAARSSAKIENVLQIARIGHDEEAREVIELGPLINTIWQEQTAGLEDGPNLRVKLNHTDPVEHVPASLGIIVENLIANAIKYQRVDEAEPWVEVATAGNGGDLELTVSDNGVGIAEGDRDKLFAMFGRFDARSGDGLGLALVSRQIERLGGTISVSSVRGAGSSFKVVLPRIQAEPSAI